MSLEFLKDRISSKEALQDLEEKEQKIELIQLLYEY